MATTTPQDFVAFLLGLNLTDPVFWPMYIGYIPDDQDQMMAVFETGGMPPVEINRDNEIVTLQMRVRSARLNYAVGRQQWLNCFNAIQDSSLGQVSVYSIVQSLHYGPIFFNDDRGRSNFITNWRIKRVTETDSD
jgi:Bacteriophage minor capsid protein